SPASVVLRSGQSFSLSDVRQSPYGQRLRDLGMQAGALVPLLARERVIGMLLVAYRETHDFDRIETALLESVARQLAVALDNARLHEQERRQRQIAEVLREAASLLGNIPQDLALETLLGLLRDIMDYDRASVLLEAEPGSLRIAAYQGFSGGTDAEDIDAVRIEINAYGYLKRLFDERTPLVVSDTHADVMWQPGAYSYGSWIGAPLIVHDHVTGCMRLAHHERGRFSEDDLRIAAAFAAQVAIAAENTRLFETEQRRRVQAELMQQATHALVSSPDLESALEAALRNLAQMLPFDQAQIGLLDENSQTWFFRAGLPPVTAASARFPIPVQTFPSIQQVIETRRPLLVADAREEAGWVPRRVGLQETRSWIGVPLVVREQLIGILNIDSFRPHAFSENSVHIAQVFANQIAAALENYRLFTEASRQNRALSALNTVLAASNEALIHEDLPAALLNRLLEALSLTQGTIHQYDRFAHELRLRAAAGLPEEVVSQLQRVPVLTTLATAALPPVTAGQVYTFFSAPLFSHGVEIGLLSIRCRMGCLPSLI
ncbi:MAG: GAF domain-containing protein, partial [Chloroflexi bacterium]